MKTLNRVIVLSFLSVILMLNSGCELVNGIFKAGMWWGILLVVGGIALVLYIISRLFFGGGKKSA
jgi:hypothetical protein